MTIWASGSVNTKPTRRRTAGPCRRVSSPATTTLPSLGTTRPLSSRARVDLPEPFAPTTPIRRSVRRRSTSRSTTRSPYRCVTPRTSITRASTSPSTASTSTATPWPPPTAQVASPYRPSRRRTSDENSRATSIAPEAPHGWPSAIAPPSGQTRSWSASSGSRPRASVHARTWAAKASVISTTSTAARGSPARASTASTAGAGPSPGRPGSTPATAVATTRRPARPSASAAGTSARTAAPSLIPQELPAVTLPPGVNAAGIRASTSGPSRGRGRSSCRHPPTATSSGVKIPSCAERTARRCERAA